MAQEPEEGGSVFDFIYVDHRRVGLYLAQFSEFGNLTKLVRSVRVSDGSQLGVNAYIARGEARTSQETGIDKHYDPQWIAPLSFLEEIQHRNMLKSSIVDSRIGDLVIISGILHMVDMRVFQKAFDTASQANLIPTAPQPKRRFLRRKPTATHPDPNFGLRLLASLNPPVFMLFENNEEKYWSTMEQDAIIVNSADLHLKYGATIAGEWQLVGIVDCLPGEITSEMSPQFCGGSANDFSGGVNMMLRELQMIMGRPPDCYGLTPLLIMREVS